MRRISKNTWVIFLLVTTAMVVGAASGIVLIGSGGATAQESLEDACTAMDDWWSFTMEVRTYYDDGVDGRRESWANWYEGAYKGESLGSIGTDVTRQRVFSSRPGPGKRSMEAGNRRIVRSDAAECTRGPGGREFGGVGSVADSAVRLGVGWLAVGPGREWPAQPRASPGEDAK